jgi:hypothetical protein
MLLCPLCRATVLASSTIPVTQTARHKSGWQEESWPLDSSQSRSEAGLAATQQTQSSCQSASWFMAAQYQCSVHSRDQQVAGQPSKSMAMLQSS